MEKDWSCETGGLVTTHSLLSPGKMKATMQASQPASQPGRQPLDHSVLNLPSRQSGSQPASQPGSWHVNGRYKIHSYRYRNALRLHTRWGWAALLLRLLRMHLHLGLVGEEEKRADLHNGAARWRWNELQNEPRRLSDPLDLRLFIIIHNNREPRPRPKLRNSGTQIVRYSDIQRTRDSGNLETQKLTKMQLS